MNSFGYFRLYAIRRMNGGPLAQSGAGLVQTIDHAVESGREGEVDEIARTTEPPWLVLFCLVDLAA